MKPTLYLALAAALALSSPAAVAATQTYGASFSGAGGDLSYGPGDVMTNVNAVLGIPLFNPGLGSLEKVTYDFSGWRSLDLKCAGGWYCTARIDLLFNLYSEGTLLAQINPQIASFTTYSPPLGVTIGDTLYAAEGVSVEVTDPSVLIDSFTADASPANDYFWISAYGNDGGAYGWGSPSYLYDMFWDGDATLTLTYHYTAPIPEPETYALMLAGLGLVGWAARRRAR